MAPQKRRSPRKDRSAERFARSQEEISAVRSILPPLAKDFWPEARQVQRRWTAWLGPTNSGKTHEALAQLRAAGGNYLAPLRLLAQEVHELFESQGIPTVLNTGEEKIVRDGARHVSATVEMGPAIPPEGLVVIDEIQMLGDAERGHAWVRALLGTPAEQVLICGAPQAEEALRTLASYAGVSLDLHQTLRKTPLSTSPDPIRLDRVPDNSIVVAFTRTDVLLLARALRDQGRSVATIYGAMPPELRRAESKRFRSGEATVVVATDAVGMGLNIPAEYVLFSTATKYDGVSERPLTTAEVLQIGGRAGRFGLFPEGVVAGMDHRTHTVIGRLFREPVPGLSGPFPFIPDFSIVSRAAEVLGTDNLAILLSRLHGSIGADAHLRSGIGPDIQERAGRIETACRSLPLSERYLLLFAPVNRQTERDFWRWTAQAARSLELGLFSRIPVPPLRPIRERGEGEELLARLALYKWLSLRFPRRYPDYEQARAHYLRILEETRSILEREGRARRFRGTRTPNPRAGASE